MKSIFTLALLVILISCGKSEPQAQNNQDEWDKNNTREINADSPELVHSKKLTKENLPYFISEFRKGQEGDFYAKLMLSESGNSEHIWLEILSLDGENSYGIIDNEPTYFKQIKYRDTLNININEAEDIMILKNDSLVFGGFLQQQTTDTSN